MSFAGASPGSNACKAFIAVDETPYERIDRLIELEGEVDNEFIFEPIHTKRSIDVSETLLARGAEVEKVLREAFDTAAKNNSEYQFLRDTVRTGTTKDKVAALQKLIRQAPVLRTRELDTIVQAAGKGDAGSMQTAVEAVANIFAEVYLPEGRELNFAENNPLKKFMHKKSARNHHMKPREVACLYIWFEDTVKRTFINLLQILGERCKDTVVAVRKAAMSCISGLLAMTDEQSGAILDIIFLEGFNDESPDVFSVARGCLHSYMGDNEGKFQKILTALRSNMFKHTAKERAITRSLNIVASLNKSLRTPLMDKEAYDFYRRFFEVVTTKSEKSSNPKNPKAAPDKSVNPFVARRLERKAKESGVHQAMKRSVKTSVVETIQGNLGRANYNHMLLLALAGFEQVIERLKKAHELDEERLKEELKMMKYLASQLSESPSAIIACMSLLQRAIVEEVEIKKSGPKKKKKTDEENEEKDDMAELEEAITRMEGPFVDGPLATAFKNPALFHARNQRIFWRTATTALACDRSPSRALEQWMILVATALHDYQANSVQKACQSARQAGRRQKSIGLNAGRFIKCQKMKLGAQDAAKIRDPISGEKGLAPVYWQSHLIGQHVDPAVAVGCLRILGDERETDRLLDGACLSRTYLHAFEKEYMGLSDLEEGTKHWNLDLMAKPLDVISTMTHGRTAVQEKFVPPQHAFIARYYRDRDIMRAHARKLKEREAAGPKLSGDERIEQAYDEEINKYMQSFGGDDFDDDSFGGDDSGNEPSFSSDDFDDELN